MRDTRVRPVYSAETNVSVQLSAAKTRGKMVLHFFPATAEILDSKRFFPRVLSDNTQDHCGTVVHTVSSFLQIIIII